MCWYAAVACPSAIATDLSAELEYVCQYNREKKRRGKVRRRRLAYLVRLTNHGPRYHDIFRSNGKRPLRTRDCPMRTKTKKMDSPYRLSLKIPKWTRTSGRPRSQPQSP